MCGYQAFGNEDNFWSRRKFRKGEFFWLCKVCSEAYKHNQYCDYCRQIYVDNGESADTDGKNWIECEKCQKWVHTDCETGDPDGYTDLANLLNDSTFQYFCPKCRGRNEPVKGPIALTLCSGSHIETISVSEDLA